MIFEDSEEIKMRFNSRKWRNDEMEFFGGENCRNVACTKSCGRLDEWLSFLSFVGFGWARRLAKRWNGTKSIPRWANAPSYFMCADRN